MAEENVEQNPVEVTDDKINNVVALNQLISTICDYYSFKNRIVEDEDEAEKWKKGDESESVVPVKIDSIIEKAFSTQLKKFTE